MQRKAVLTINLKSDPLSQKRVFKVVAATLLLGWSLNSNLAWAHGFSKERLLPSGTYLPFFSSQRKTGTKLESDARKPVFVASFWMDIYPVTNGDFLQFVKSNPSWRRSQISQIFADASYLKHWKTDLALKNSADFNRPVTHVSWFAANAFCESLGRELPTTDQWEYAANNSGQNSEQIKQMILDWYSQPNSKSLPSIGISAANTYGIHDLIGVIWEWTLDFNSTMVGSELRNSGTKQEDLFCGAGSLGALDASDYAKFMRYSFRSSLKAEYTTANLGFRCVKEAKR